MDLNKLPEDVKPTWSELLAAGLELRTSKSISQKDHIVQGPQEYRGVLLRDQKQICPVACANLPINLPRVLHVAAFQSASLSFLPSSESFKLQPRGQAVGLLEEWKRFLTYLRMWDKIAVVYAQGWQLFLKPPQGQLWDSESFVDVFYCTSKIGSDEERIQNRVTQQKEVQIAAQVTADGTVSQQKSVQSKAAQMHPDYLQTLRQTHNGWLFGAIAELVDNARDAKATRLEISVKYGYLRGAKNTQIPMLCIEDNGTGMNHEEIIRMIAFGHKRPDDDDPTQIGRFGVGFKTGAMKLGKDTVVFTQGKETRSIALLSSSFNEGKDVLEVPVVTYHKQTGRMEYDLRAQTKEVARANEKAVMEHSPFDKYGIGHELSKFDSSTGTRIYVYNLEKWGSEYCLQWEDESSTSKIRDIKIRSRRVRTRPGQTSQEVALDYSLHAYLEVVFLEPEMIIYVQGSQVKTRRLAKSLNRTEKIKDIVLGKEAYKRVGNMIHSADWGRGVVGVIDTTSLMEFGKGRVGVLNNKQGFEDSEAYAVLEKWLGQKSDKYWEAHEEDLEVDLLLILTGSNVTNA
ncbi:hypothetical protein O6H91_04G051200 [Diphasiastrum complanatum]|uniref:Uncharacterized protein n=1 Tax=Diphasiastrum complanatum TaxID=34168 RepID=A0ACC2DWZ4_DIPCM|nr:hypothetical protein O6H91_04G051200 [Diphasiastrum complanatum]